MIQTIEVSRCPTRAGLAELLDQFRQLRVLNPKSLTPFLVLFVYLMDCFDAPSLMKLVEEAKVVDFHLTYAAFLYVTMRNSFIRQPVKTKESIQCLQAAYPSDLVLPQVFKMLNTVKTELDFDLSPIRESLCDSLEEMVGEDALPAVKRLIGETPKLAGYSLLQHYLVLAYLLNGNVKQAKFIFSRSDKLLEMEHPFHTGYIERFIAGTVQKCFNRPNPTISFDPDPIDTPLSVFIEMAEAKRSILSLH